MDFLALSFDLPFGADKTPPTEFRIFPFGKVETSKGTFTFDAAGAKALMVGWREQGNELVLDWGHAILDPSPVDPAEAGKAAGWFKLDLRNDGLYAVDVRWTPLAEAKLRAGEYRYFSPAFPPSKDGRISSLLNVALTNIPATKHLQPLVAASAVPFAAHPVVEDVWDADAAIGRLRKWAGVESNQDLKDATTREKYAQGFALVDGDGTQLGDYRLPHHDVQGGRLVTSKRGVEAAAAAVNGARGGMDIPADELPAVKRHLASHYHEWGGKAPWENETMKELTKLGRHINAKSKEHGLSHEDLAEKVGMKPEELDELKRAEEPTKAHRAHFKALARHLKTPVASLRALADGDEPDGDEPEVKASRDIAEVVALTGKPTVNEALGVVQGWKAASEQVTALSAKVAALEAAHTEREVAAAVDGALKAGKLVPAQREWATGLGRKDLVQLKAFLETAPTHPAATGERETPKAPVIALSAEERTIARQTGVTEAALLARKQERAAARS